MKLVMNKLIKVLTLLLLPTITFAQNIEMADAFRSSGKIYVVVAIMVILFAGLLGYLITIDKKVSKLEKELENK